MADSPFSIFRRFLRFGLLAWGGPVAQIAMVRHELVEQERWIAPERFNRALAVYQALPGPEAHELCVYLGYVRGGRLGGLAAGLGFMLPGFVLVLGFAAAYDHLGLRSSLAVGLFAGFAPAVAALVLRAVRRIGAHALHDRWLWAVALLAAAAQLLGVHFAMPLIGGALAYWIVSRGWGRVALALLILAAACLLWWSRLEPPADRVVAGPARSELREPGLSEVGAAGLRAGLLTFGGAYTALAFVEQDAVVHGRWLTRGQFLDGLAISSSIPAPLIIFATFVGYLGGALPAALVITVAIFAPAFAFTLLGHRHLERLVDDARAHALLDGVTAAVVGLMAVIAATLTIQAIDSWWAGALLLGALVVLARWTSRLSIVAVMLGCGLLGMLATQVA